MRGFTLMIVVITIGLALQPAFADDGWTPVIHGVDWREFSLTGPNHAYVVRMDRSDPTLTLESGLPWGTLSGERQTVSEMAAHYDQAINAWDGTWGERNRVVAAINGSYFDLETGEPNSGMVLGGWYAKMFSTLGGWSGISWKYDGSAFVGACIDRPADGQVISSLINGTQLQINGVNTKVKGDQLVIFTPQYDDFSPGQKHGVEVLVGLYQPLGLNHSRKPTIGTVQSIYRDHGPIPIPFDAIVISARGSAADALLASIAVGDVLSFSLPLIHYESDCRTRSPYNWAGTYTSIGGTLPFLRDGEVVPFSDAGAAQLHPRTAICFNETWLYFVVVDGRNSSYSIGMSIPELAEFCKDELGATWGVNQDGGGSSTLYLDGEVINRPSGGTERRVANSLMIVAVEPGRFSDEFRPGSMVTTLYATNLHLGPGVNFPAVTSVAGGVQGKIQPHLAGLNGVFAKGTYWWKVRFPGIDGWVDQSALFTEDHPPVSSLPPLIWAAQ